MEKSFKRKTIQNIIEYKIGKWLKSFPEDQKDLVEKIKSSYIVTGGSIASMLMGQMPNDLDVYFNNADVLTELAQYYTSKIATNEKVGDIEVINHNTSVEIKIKSAGVAGEDVDLTHYSYFEYLNPEDHERFLSRKTANKGKYKPHYITSNAISLSDDIQIITRFVGDPAEIHKNFDYVHATNYYSKETGLVINQAALESIMTRQLRYIGSLFPISTLFRMKKFLKRDWTISAGDIVKISWDVSKLDMTNTAVLQEQLTGMDVAYFNEVMSILNKELNGRDLDRTYLFEVISKIFDQEDMVEEMVKIAEATEVN